MNSKNTEFEIILNEITNDLATAAECSFLYRKIDEYSLEYQSEINQSSTFWSIIMISLLTSSILSLTRIYDFYDSKKKDKSKTIGLITLLNYAEKHLDLIANERVKRIPKKVDAEENIHNPNFSKKDSHLLNLEDIKEQVIKKIEEHKCQINEKHEIINKLIQIRVNLVAHKSIKGLSDHQKISWNEFDELLNRGLEIRNYYAFLYDISTYSGVENLCGKENYQYVFKYLRIASKTLKFINLNAKNPEKPQNYESLIDRFIGEVRDEIYKKLK